MVYFADKASALEYFLEHIEKNETIGRDSFGWFVLEKEHDKQ